MREAEADTESRIQSVISSFTVFDATGGGLDDLVDSVTGRGRNAMFSPDIVARAIARLPIGDDRKTASMSRMIDLRMIGPLDMRRALEVEGFSSFGICVHAACSGKGRKARHWAKSMGFQPELAKGLSDDGILSVGPGVTHVPPCNPKGLDMKDSDVVVLSGITTPWFCVATCRMLKSMTAINVDAGSHGAPHFRLYDLPVLEDMDGVVIRGTDVSIAGCPNLAELTLASPLSAHVSGSPLMGGLAIRATEGHVMSELVIDGVKGPLAIPSAIYGEVTIDSCPALDSFPADANVIHSLAIRDCAMIRTLAGSCRGSVRVEDCPSLESIDTGITLIDLDGIPDSMARRPRMRPKDGAVNVQIGACAKLVRIGSRLGNGPVILSLQIRNCPSLVDIPQWASDLLALKNPSYVCF